MSVGKSESGQFVPKLEEENDYLDFRKEVLLWEGMTTMGEDQRAPNLAFRLPKKAKKEVLDMSREELSKGVTRTVEGEEVKVSGVMRLLEVLDSIYLEDLHREKFKAYCQFRNFKRTSCQSVHDFLLYYDAKKRHLEQHGIKLPEEIYAFEVLASANLTEDQEALANCTVQSLTYSAMKEQIKKIVLRTNSTENSSKSGLIKVVKSDDSPFFLREEEEKK